ncbi:SEC10/PgrA surface exclusion domain-containing protein [Lactobacillus kitasatonis]|uniref:SEC10/PgrA surface exclusion domain-containing protein n=1 Tax=Lactobacillus kitasatonis TaxID=237446 RepID=A0ABS1LSN8_9LACO|nr:SEC10/PgrA surface exclusion domain-containing protein [Lactobacillus kitasatonis]MBL1071268.1 SEC10/PgrA surface exclusion domain-containing protein [Lactobacillus kitasatonis]
MKKDTKSKSILIKALAWGATGTALLSGAMMMNNNKVEASSSSIVLLKFKHNAYRYNKNGKRIGTGYITKGSTYYSKGAYRIHGKKYHKLDTKGNIYVKDGNLSTRRLTNQVTLKHNAYIYNIHGRRINRQKLYKGVSYFIYGSRYINGKKYYQIGVKEYIKASNASAPFSTYGQSSNNDVDNTTNNSNVSNNSATNTSTTTQTNTNTNVGSNTSSNNSSVTNNQSASSNSSSSANHNIQLPNNSSQSNNTGNQGSTTKPSTGNSGSQATKPNIGNQGSATKPSTGNSGSQNTKPNTGNQGSTTKPSTGNNGSQVTKPNTGNQSKETQPSQPTYSKNYVKLPAGYLEAVKNANWEKTSVPDELIRKGVEINNFHSESKADDEMKIDSDNLTPAQDFEINDFALRLINNVRAENGQQPWHYSARAQHVADRVAYLYEQDHMGLSTWHDDKALNEVDREAGIHTAELMGGDNVNYKEDYLNTMTDLKRAVYSDVVSMLFSTVELRHAQIMLTYNSIDNPTTYFGFSVSWQEHNKDGYQEHSDHFIAY